MRLSLNRKCKCDRAVWYDNDVQVFMGTYAELTGVLEGSVGIHNGFHGVYSSGGWGGISVPLEPSPFSWSPCHARPSEVHFLLCLRAKSYNLHCTNFLTFLNYSFRSGI